MTKEMLIAELKRIQLDNDGDPESDHVRADELLIAYINDSEVADAYLSIYKWYA